MYYLAGDIGGTKALLQLMKVEPSTSISTPSNQTHSSLILGEKRYLCHEFDSLESIITSFLQYFHLSNKYSPAIDSACFGLPGLVDGRVVKLTNLPWVVNADLIEQVCGIQTVRFVNDFYAAALGVDALMPADKITLYSPKETPPNEGNRLVIGAGTGLGVAPVFYDGQNYLPQASEGGHFDFAPISETQQILLNWLWQTWEHVSYERVLSGPGLETLYAFFLQHDLPNSYSQTSSQKLHANKVFNLQNKHVGLLDAAKEKSANLVCLAAEEIQQAAEEGEPIAIKAITEFVTIYGAFVGSIALVWNAPGGIYLAGGVALKLQKWMQSEVFIKAFLEKGRMKKVVMNKPIYLVADESLGLKGAMQAAKAWHE